MKRNVRSKDMNGTALPLLAVLGLDDVGASLGFSIGGASPDRADTGFNSLTIRHTVHLNTSKYFGHRTKESQVAHLPVMRSFSPICAEPLGAEEAILAFKSFPADRGFAGNGPFSMSPSPSASSTLCELMRPLKSETIGWLCDLECQGFSFKAGALGRSSTGTPCRGRS